MKKYFKDLLRTTSIHAIAIMFLVWTFTVFAVTFPSSTPTWETAWWLFMTYFTKMLVNTNIATTDWNVKNAAAVPWSGVTSKPTFAINSTVAWRVRMYDVGCESSYWTSCDANGNGRLDNAENANTTDGYHLNQAVTSGASPQWGTTYTNNWFRSQGATGWYSETYGWWWYMSDTTWLRAYNNKNIYTAGSIQANTKVTTPQVCLNWTCRTSWPSSWYTHVWLTSCNSFSVGDGQTANCGSKVMVAAAAFWQNQLSVTCCSIYLY
jgi:hypothetical protein